MWHGRFRPRETPSEIHIALPDFRVIETLAAAFAPLTAGIVLRGH
jgi:hypothetical protein